VSSRALGRDRLVSLARPAALLALAAAALALPLTASAAPSPADLEAELVCPTCKTTLDQSDAPVARRMKQIIRERIAAGATADEIRDELVAQFGPAVLAEPPKRGFDLLAWLLPLAALVLGAAAVGAAAWTWSRRREEPAPPGEPLDPELDRRVDEELARFDG
jgi:cytochrome c-type biogenesis protein CcmH